MFLDFFFPFFNEICLAFMVLGEAVIFTVRAIAFTTFESKKSYFLFAKKTFGMISLFGSNRWLWVFNLFDFLFDVVELAILP